MISLCRIQFVSWLALIIVRSVSQATVKTEIPGAMAGIMSLSLRNGGLNKFGALQSTLTILPPSPSSRVDGTKLTRKDRLESLADVPTDDRASEVASALAVSGFFGICGLANVFGLDDITPYSNLAVTTMVTVGILDNFYDALRFGSSLLKDKLNNDNVQLPEKGSMPLNLGTGQLTGTVARGLTRLISVDTERDCQCEAAAFFVAYSLGLPCFAFRPNALEVRRRVFCRNYYSECHIVLLLINHSSTHRLQYWWLNP